jgi:hypothetical protein
VDTSVSLLDRPAAAPTDDDWRRLLELYQPTLRAWMARAGVPASAADLAQEVLLVLFREVGAFERGGPGAFRSWLRTVLAHRVRDYFRGQKYRPTAPGDSDFLRRLFLSSGSLLPTVGGRNFQGTGPAAQFPTANGCDNRSIYPRGVPVPRARARASSCRRP